MSNPDVSQPGSSTPVTNQTRPSEASRPSVSDLGVNEPRTVTGNSVRSPLTGSDVSMTTAQPYGGPIVSTEQTKVANKTGPNA